MAKADRVHSTPRRTASKIKHPKTAKAKRSVIAGDAKLTAAAIGLERADALTDLYKKFGDDADSRADYQALEVIRNEHIATLVTVPARSAAGILAKASALRLPRMIEDWDQHQQIAVSLADDIVDGADPIFAAIYICSGGRH